MKQFPVFFRQTFCAIVWPMHPSRYQRYAGFLLVTLVFAASGCKKVPKHSDSDVFTVNPPSMYRGELKILKLKSVAFHPQITRSFNCGTNPIDIDDRFEVRIHRTGGGSEAKWISLKNPKWIWETRTLEVTVTRELSSRLNGRFYDIQVTTPDSQPLRQNRALEIISTSIPIRPNPIDTETNSDTDSAPGKSSDDHDTQSSVEVDTSPGIIIAKKYAGEIKIDERIEGWPTWDGTPFAHQINNRLPSTPSGNTTPPAASFDAVWTKEGLYLVIRVVDDVSTSPSQSTLKVGDAIEIFFDVPPVSNNIYSEGDNWIIIGKNKEAVLFRTEPASEIEIGHGDGGTEGNISSYFVEMRIPWEALGMSAPTAETIIGFDIGVNDRDDGEDRDFKTMWNRNYENYDSTAGFGQLIISMSTLPENSPEPPINDCLLPRLAYPDTAIPVTWAMYDQTADLNTCAGGNADVWFNVVLPPLSTMRISAEHSKPVKLFFKRSLSSDCTSQQCNVSTSPNDTLLLSNSSLTEDATIPLIISASEYDPQTTSVFFFDRIN